MKQITLNNKEYLLVEVSNDAKNIKYNHTPDWKLKHLVFTCEKDTWYSADFIDAKLVVKIIGKLGDILKDEEICKGLVESINMCDGHFTSKKSHKEYINYHGGHYYLSAVESMYSWLKSIKLDMTKEYALIEQP